MEFNVSLRKAIKTGKVVLGQHETERCVMDGEASMVVVAKNCPEAYRDSLTSESEVFVYTFDGSSVQLGKACGKPHMVSALAVVNPGESDIISLKRT
ncbi:MAG: 50S ribosomal protein L30e [Methanospirillum sp.]|nr:50S ribosomal protein L30e [Methanospirillum sp.]